MAWHRWVSVLPERQGLSPGCEEAGKAAAPEGMEEPMGIGLGVPLVVGLMMAGGWLALEWFNYSASQYALTVFFGNLMADGLSWAVLLALGLWLVDLSGLLYLSLPSEREKPGFWYVLVAWLLASGANALLKWWAVTLALMASPLAQPGAGGTSRVASLFQSVGPYIPTAIAFLVWTGRVLLVSTMMGLLLPVLRQLGLRLQTWAEQETSQAAGEAEAASTASMGPRLVESGPRARHEWSSRMKHP
jgi:hypothetical protein